MSRATPKLYRCRECGNEVMLTTNHYGETYAAGNYNVCRKCPPWKANPYFGGMTVWLCVTPPPKFDCVTNGLNLIAYHDKAQQAKITISKGIYIYDVDSRVFPKPDYDLMMRWGWKTRNRNDIPEFFFPDSGE